MSARDTMTRLVKAQSDARLIEAHALALAAYKAAPLGASVAEHLTLHVVEVELLDREIPMCTQCGCPGGAHDADMH